ncbi:MAG: class I SAM-dependent methyltransferase [Candidatus Omnitrophica bacterium]|nr:class I SAM-dependent methyltransferase [Candidatus Omnitrophota bacterium]
MSIYSRLLNVPILWNLSQAVFGCDSQKKKLYRSVFSRTGRLLDFGCADGNTFLAFTDFDYYGVDINKQLIDYAAKKYHAFNNAHFVNADILSHPFEDDFFDYALFSCTGHHLPDTALFPVMEALSAVLQPGGRLHFFDTIRRPGKDSGLLKFLISIDQGKFMRDEETYMKIIHRFSRRLKVVTYKTLSITGTLMPQPDYFYAEFEKV